MRPERRPATSRYTGEPGERVRSGDQPLVVSFAGPAAAGRRPRPGRPTCCGARAAPADQLGEVGRVAFHADHLALRPGPAAHHAGSRFHGRSPPVVRQAARQSGRGSGGRRSGNLEPGALPGLSPARCPAASPAAHATSPPMAARTPMTITTSGVVWWPFLALEDAGAAGTADRTTGRDRGREVFRFPQNVFSPARDPASRPARPAWRLAPGW